MTIISVSNGCKPGTRGSSKLKGHILKDVRIRPKGSLLIRGRITSCYRFRNLLVLVTKLRGLQNRKSDTYWPKEDAMEKIED